MGYETVLDMYPLDFEEFLWANQITDDVISFLKICLNEEKMIPEALHKRLYDLFLKYIVVCGIPDVVNTYLKTNRMDEVLNGKEILFVLMRTIWLNTQTLQIKCI